MKKRLDNGPGAILRAELRGQIKGLRAAERIARAERREWAKLKSRSHEQEQNACEWMRGAIRIARRLLEKKERAK